ncbi:MAG: helix-turn-helix domain-containing protein [Lachnospiraceae bacterium]|nr:helix-turn-helix domain-containing protein [Lachnospiraceae bacterium]
MSKIVLLARALEYMEENLSFAIRTEDVARACYCSKSTLEKLFQGINHMTVHEYMVLRRMTVGARLLRQDPEMSVLEIALQLGYGSNEAFSRAFRQVWNCNPSEFRERSGNHFTEVFPRLRPPMESGDEYVRERRQVDISELYDLFKERSKCYFLCCDIKHMMDINAISQKAGDKAILEAIERLQAVAGPEDVVFRIGGDEFAVLTASEDVTYARGLMEQLAAVNGSTYRVEAHTEDGKEIPAQEIPMTLHIGVTKLENERIRYEEMFSKLHTTIKDSKQYDGE